MKGSTIVLGFVAAAVAASMALAQPAATDKSTGTAPASTAPSGTTAPAKAAPAKTSPGKAPAATAPAGTPSSTTAPSATSQGAGTGAAAAGKEPHRGSAAADGTAPLLTPDEANAHRAAMQSFKNVDECNAYFVKHQKLVNDRAKEKGVAAPANRGSPCARMAARGFHP